MPVVGNLSEFPLPEVLLLIGQRTGRLRLLDIPEFGMLEVDVFNGQAHSLYLGTKTFTEVSEMIEKLSSVVQAQTGMFEFRGQAVVPVVRAQPLFINQLVMSLVCHVDERMARQRATTTGHHWYMLQTPQPEIWIEPELHEFFLTAKPFLITGAYPDNLAERLKLDATTVHKNLTNLRLLGLVKLIDGVSTVPLARIDIEEKVSRKSSEFLKAARAASEIQRVTGNLPRIEKP
jgi:hypothetical protein